MTCPDNFVYVGNKEIMKYVESINKGFGFGHDNVVVKARGKSINKAVIAALVARDTFDDIDIGKIECYTENIPLKHNKNKKISALEIHMYKNLKVEHI